jgi:MFS transporter, OFA family, oxalate/formate antiporter
LAPADRRVFLIICEVEGMATRQAGAQGGLGPALAAATIVGLPLGSIYAFSVLLAPLEQILQASRSELASVFGISTVFFTLGTNMGPQLFGAVRAPLLVALTAALCASGVILAAVAPSLSWFVVGYGLIFATGGGMAYVVVQQSVNSTPLTRPGLVNGYLVSLFPLGAMLAAPAFGLGLDLAGVRQTLAGLAVLIAATGVAGALLVAQAGIILSKARDAPTPQATGAKISLRATFWKICMVFFLAASAGLMVLSQAAGMVVAFGADKSVAVLATTGFTAAIAVARVLGGWLTDRLPVPFVAASAQSIALCGAVALTLIPSPGVAIVTLGSIGVGYGLISGVTVAAVAAYWPKVEFGRVIGRTFIAWCLAAITLPILAGRLYDLTGGYELAVIVAGGANLLAVVVALTLPSQRCYGARPRA